MTGPDVPITSESLKAHFGIVRDGAAKWREYDMVAEWCAKNGFKGAIGDPLPEYTGDDVCGEIAADPEAFERRVKDCAYAIAMERHQGK